MHPVFRRTPERTTAHLNDTVILNCSAFAIPPADYIWTRDEQQVDIDGVRVQLDNGSLIINTLSRSDAGQYVCRASNEHGEIVSDPASLVVMGECVCECGMYVISRTYMY